MIEAPLELQQTLKVPQNHYDICNLDGVKTEGNAAGNTVDVFDLSKQNKSVAPLPAGFTAKGIVALVFSCAAAFLGIAVISWSVFPAPLSRYSSRLTIVAHSGTESNPSEPRSSRPRSTTSPRLACPRVNPGLFLDVSTI